MIRLKGYSELEIGNSIELPDMAELIKYPFFNKNDIEYCYKHANSDVKYLLDKVPLKNDRKYISVRLLVQYLSPNVVSVPRGSWHYDTLSHKDDEVCHTHLLITQCSAMTEFSENEIILPQFAIGDTIRIEQFMNANTYMFKPKACPANSFVTFSGHHPHRCTRPKDYEFRFMFRVTESNYLKCSNEGILNYSEVYIDNHDMENLPNEYVMNKRVEGRKSIEKNGDKITIYAY